MQKPSIADLIAAVAISKTYASDILADRQAPSLPLAIHIFRKTGWRPKCIEDWTADQIDALEQAMPWQPRRAQEAA